MESNANQLMMPLALHLVARNVSQQESLILLSSLPDRNTLAENLYYFKESVQEVADLLDDWMPNVNRFQKNFGYDMCTVADSLRSLRKRIKKKSSLDSLLDIILWRESPIEEYKDIWVGFISRKMVQIKALEISGAALQMKFNNVYKSSDVLKRSQMKLINQLSDVCPPALGFLTSWIRGRQQIPPECHQQLSVLKMIEFYHKTAETWVDRTHTPLKHMHKEVMELKDELISGESNLRSHKDLDIIERDIDKINYFFADLFRNSEQRDIEAEDLARQLYSNSGMVPLGRRKSVSTTTPSSAQSTLSSKSAQFIHTAGAVFVGHVMHDWVMSFFSWNSWRFGQVVCSDNSTDSEVIWKKVGSVIWRHYIPNLRSQHQTELSKSIKRLLVW